MPSAVERAVSTYIRASSEPDPVARAELLEACFAPDGRLVSRARELRGRAELAEMFTRFHADPNLLGIRVLSTIDAGRTTFRFHAVADFRNGKSLESFDAGESDADGRISLILSFAGPLAPAGG
jgi:hypothetical protein